MNTKSISWFIGCIVIVFVGAFYIKSWSLQSQQAATVNSQPSCGPLSFYIDPTTPVAGTIVRGQQNKPMLSVTVRNGNCAAKIATIAFKQVGTAGIGEIERGFVVVPGTQAPLLPSFNGTNIVFNSIQHPILVPANAGNVGSSVPAVKIDFWLSASNAAAVGKTYKLQVDGNSFAAVTQSGNNPLTINGAFPIVGNTFTVPALAANISTNTATNITTSSAKLKSNLLGSYFGGTGQARYYYATSSNYLYIFGNQTPSVAITPGMTTFDQTVSGLASNTTYYYRVCAQSAVFVCGAVQSFTTNQVIDPNDISNG